MFGAGKTNDRRRWILSGILKVKSILINDI